MTTTIIPPANRLGQTKAYYFSRKLKEIAQLKAQGQDIINLGIGSPDLPPHPSVIKTLIDTASQDDNHGYQSYAGIPALRQAFANWYKHWFYVSLNPNTEVLPLMGSKEGIMHISMAFLNTGDEVLVPNPGYPTYTSATKLAGGVVRPYTLKAENNWLPDLDQLEKDGLDKVKIMWVNYPHMPTGAQGSKAFFEKLIAFAQRNNILLVNDNPYAFILTEKPLSLLSLTTTNQAVLELTSLSKAQNMAGWRVGALLGNAALIETVLRFKSNMDSGSFRPIQLAAVQALELGQDWYSELNAIYQERREIVYQIFDLLGCAYVKNQVGLFVWAKCPQGQEGFGASDEILKDNKVFITPGGVFGKQGKEYLRISLCTKKTRLIEVVERLKEAQQGNIKS